MNKIKKWKKIKTPACIIMAVLITLAAPVTAYMEASAVEVAVPTTMEILQAVLTMFGVSVGLGNQSDYFSQSSFEDFSAAISNGHVYHMDNYGDVDFSDNDSVSDWLSWADGIDSYLAASGNAPIALYSSAIKTGAMTIDYASYKMTGTSATTAMHNYINSFIGDYNAGTEALAEDIRETFTVITGGAGNNDDDEDPEKAKSRFKRIMAVISAAMLGGSNVFAPFAELKEARESAFNEYDEAFKEGFSGTYLTGTSGQYVCDVYFEANGGMSNGFKICRYRWHYEGEQKIFGYINSGKAEYGYFAGTPDLSNYRSVKFASGEQTNLSTGIGSGYTDSSSVSVSAETSSSNAPIFSSKDAALDYFASGDASGILNLNEAYADFKSSAASAAARLGNYLRSFLMSPKYLKKLPDTVKPVLDAADAGAGMADSIDKVEEELAKIAPGTAVDPVPDPDPDPGPSAGENYFGILGQILAVLKNIYLSFDSLRPEKFLVSFAGRFMTADSLERILTGKMPSLFAESFAEAVSLPLKLIVEAINALPDSFKARIIEIFPDSAAVGNAIIGFPEAVAEAVEGLDIKVPDITIPEIKIPEIVVPDIVVPDIVIPEITAPDVNVELNPSYNITVANDFTGLGEIILGAVENALNVCFVPDEAAAMEKLSDMGDYFKFKDDIIAAVGDLKTMLFGITPSPILKIPIGKPASQKYNYGTGSYIIIDVSWYAQYKQFGDKVILAAAWALFLWRMFIKLPGIISGTEGSIIAADKAHNRYMYTKFSRKE